ncbi:deoxyribose-phosphate aldolase [Rubritalea marina]|uniref:deoxyribose-phosphate aldolase n=1 Tax=Rubritalea marina TaxID=361055 RepID=UPI00036EDC13|nr:deoxyribose-phosphate aldolase [Rubritalea marina]
MLNPSELTPEAVASIIDHTYLKPFGSPEPINTLCAEAKKYQFAMVAINPAEVERCAELLSDSPVRVGAAIGFPLGQNTVAVKDFETKDAIDKGATEIDIMINVRALKAGQTDIIRQEIRNMVKHCKPSGVISKVIFETCYLDEADIITVCNIAKEEGADFVKTSTGFGTAGASVEHIALMRKTVGPEMGVKASGGVRTLDEAIAMIEAGATRIGTSSGVRIVEELIARQKGVAFDPDAMAQSSY